MKTIWKVIIVAIAAGAVLMLLGFATGGSISGFYMEGGEISIVNYDETKITEMDLGYVSDINVEANHSNVEFVSADTYGVDILAYGDDLSWELVNGTLFVRQSDPSKITFFDFSFTKKDSHIKVYLPADAELGKVSVSADSGSIKIGGFQSEDVQISNMFGDIDIHGIMSEEMVISLDCGRFVGTDLNTRVFAYENDYGNGIFEGVEAEKLKIASDAGDLTLRNCTAGEADITNNFGKVTASGLNSTKLTVIANCGDIDLDGKFSGETAIYTDFGNVSLATSIPKENYSYEMATDFGKIKIGNDKKGSNVSYGNDQSTNNLIVEVSTGDIDVSFAK